MNGDNDSVNHGGSVDPERPGSSSHGIDNQQQQQPVEPFSRKRKLASVLADPFARLAACSSAADGSMTAANVGGASSNGGGDSKSGRGSQAGWTYCPICFPLSKKMFAR